MNQDPLDHLQSFYDDCNSAPLPTSLTVQPQRARWWQRALLPMGGISLGGVIAMAIVTAPSAPDNQATEQVALSIARRQLVAIQPPAAPLHLEILWRRLWSA